MKGKIQSVLFVFSFITIPILVGTLPTYFLYQRDKVNKNNFRDNTSLE